jgi:hypothetical protein
MKAREAEIQARDRHLLRKDAERVVQLYEAWGKPDKAQGWQQRLGKNPLDRDFPADPFAP